MAVRANKVGGIGSPHPGPLLGGEGAQNAEALATDAIGELEGAVEELSEVLGGGNGERTRTATR